jgi:tetraacyldisaccharide 4'-kinase
MRSERLVRAMRSLLVPLSWPYGAAAAARRRWWRGRARSLPAPVVSVGNLTCGGTGKTPVVEMVVRDLLARGWSPAILSRGYGPAASGSEAPRRFNDEYLVLAENLPGVPHYQGGSRLETGRVALERGADILVLDDGFQHFQLARDLDMVLIDALDPFGGGNLLPAGLLREPVAALAAASLVGITRCELAPAAELEALAAYLALRFPGLPQVLIESRPEAWADLDGKVEPAAALRGRPVLGFCGIGNPEAFRRQLLALDVELRGWAAFRDHRRYSAADVSRLARLAAECGAQAVVMTQKDAVKLRSPELRREAGELPWRYLRIRFAIRSGEEGYRRALESLGR